MRIWFLIIVSALTLIALNLYSNFEGWGKPSLYPPSKAIKHFSLGHRDTLADMFWLRAIQDFGTCEQSEAYTKENLNPQGARMGPNRVPSCKRGWLYHMLDLIMELAPRFHMVAATGPLVLSVIVDDIEGATLLFERALKAFPEDWEIKFRAAYHYMIELENKPRAAELFLQAAEQGAPEWTILLAAKLREQNGEKAVARFILQNFLERQDIEIKNRDAAEQKLDSLRDR